MVTDAMNEACMISEFRSFENSHNSSQISDLIKSTDEQSVNFSNNGSDVRSGAAADAASD